MGTRDARSKDMGFLRGETGQGRQRKRVGLVSGFEVCGKQRKVVAGEEERRASQVAQACVEGLLRMSCLLASR